VKSGNLENTNRPLALIITFLIHGLLFLVLYLIVLHTPIPPYPEGGGSGLEVNLGNSDEGTGDIQPENITTGNKQYLKETNNSKTDVKAKSDNNNIITQNKEDAPSLYSNKNKEVKIDEPVINKNALYKKHNAQSSGGSEGETGNPGDQGKTNGTIYTNNHNGDGTGGNGTGNDKGDGNDKGNGKGTGTSYNLGGRKANSLPKPAYTGIESGKVVVAILVDRKGNVIKASPGIKGSTTNEISLLNAAKKAALSTKFERNDSSPEEQRGTITYNFVLE
jgi:periplasmic protein TonB